MVESRKLLGVDLGAPAEPPVVRLFVKTPWQEEEFLVHKDMLVQEFKEQVARNFSSPPDQVVLVSAGRILKDHRTLGQHRIHLDKDAATVYVVIRASGGRPSRQVSAAPGSATPDQKCPRSGRLASGDLRELTASLGLNTDNFSAFQSQLMSNPDMMLQLLENPFIQNRLSSPTLMKELVTGNPKVQQVIQKAPQISHVFGSPEGMRLVVGLAKNPAAVREFIKCPPQAGPGSVPSGDSSGAALQDALSEMQGLVQRAIPRLLGNSVPPGPPGGHQPHPEHGEKTGQAREKMPPPRGWPPKPPAQNSAVGPHEHSKGESGALRGEAGPLASVTVKNLLHQIIKHLMQSLGGGSPPRSSHTPERRGRRSQRNTAVASRNSPREHQQRQPQAALQIPDLLRQIQSTDVLLANWSPKEIQGLLEIQRRLQALAVDTPRAERRGRPERPMRKARSITSLGDLLSPAASKGSDFPAQQTLHDLAGAADLLAGIRCAGCLRGSSAQPPSRQKRLYKV